MQKIRDLLAEKHISMTELRWLVQLFKPHFMGLLGLTFLRCALIVLGIGSTLVNKQLVDWASAFFSVKGTILLTIACSCTSLLGGAGLSYLSTLFTQRCTIRIRADLYAHLLESVWPQRTQLHSEDYLTRMTSDVDRICDGIIGGATGLVGTAVQFLLAFALLYSFDPSIALFALLCIPVIALCSLGLGFYLKRIHLQVQQADADCRIFLQEQLSHADVLKAFEQEAKSRQTLLALLEKKKALTLKSSRYSIGMRIGVTGAFSATYLFALITGALKIASGSITYGTMTAFLSLVNQVQSPVLSLSSILSQLIAVWASASRIHEITAMQTEAHIPAPLQTSGAVGIRAQNVSFSYPAGEPVLQDLSFEIAPGTIAAVMGHSGIGKTTLIRLLLGFLSADSGTLVFTAEQTSLPCSPATRKLISYVPQGNTLFSGTIAENLRLGCPTATDQELFAALRLACADQFVQALPKGLDTIVGEKGHGLSEGQAQRIAIARAFLRPAPVLILDEATSALDEQTELAILEHLRTVRPRQTCVVISHRSTVSHFADQMIVLSSAAATLPS